MHSYVSVRNVEIHASTTGVHIKAWTDIPCHLAVRLSSKEPWIHRKPSFRRGVAFAEDVRFCFTVYEDNEQNEWGDTYVHNWWKTNWPVCTTKWFYIWGLVAGVVAVSTTAPFSFHNDGVSPETPWGLVFHEPWTLTIPPPQEYTQLVLEPWSEEGIRLEQKVFEPWTS